MFAAIKLKTRDFLTNGQERSIQAKKNIAISIFLKGIGVVISLLLVPVTISFVDATQYGIWLTLSSVISWFSFFDVGLGNGLRNQLSKANALTANLEAKVFVSTAYAIISLISIAVFLTFAFLNGFIDWQKVLNAKGAYHFPKLFLILLGFFCLQFVSQLINTVLTALHLPSKAALINVVGQFCCLIIIIVLTKSTTGSLLTLVLVFAGVPVVVQVLASILIYSSTFRRYAPNLRFVNFHYAKDLLRVGAAFFFIQIGALIIYQTDNLIITQIFGPTQVTTFSVASKLFSVFSMFFSIVMTPFWSAYTDAYAKKDFDWIKRVFRKMERYLLYLCFLMILFLFVSPYVYAEWLQSKIQVPFLLSTMVVLCVLANCWMIHVCYFLNGINKVRLQLYLYLVAMVVNIPLAVWLGKCLGVLGIPLSNFLVLACMAFVLRAQSMKIIHNKATGIWNI